MVAEAGVICIIHIIIIRLLMNWRPGINHNQVGLRLDLITLKALRPESSPERQWQIPTGGV